MRPLCCSMILLTVLLSALLAASAAAARAPRRAAVVASSTGPFGFGRRGDSVHASRRLSVVPYRPGPGNTLLVQCRLNQSVSVTLLLDTGAERTLITDALADRLGLLSTPRLDRDGVPMRFPDGTPQREAGPCRLQLGSLEFRAVECVVFPEPRLVSFLGTGVEGILGMDLLGGSALLLDFEAREITLWRPGKLDRLSLAAAGMRDASAVPLTDADSAPTYSVRASFGNSVEEELVVDTGAAETVLSLETGARLKLQPYQQEEFGTLFGSGRYNRSRVPRISLGSVTLPDQVVLSPVEPASRFTRLLGIASLSAFRVLLDFPGKQMYLKPVGPADLPAFLPLRMIGRGGIPAVPVRLADGKERWFLIMLEQPGSAISAAAARELLREPGPAAPSRAVLRAGVRLGPEGTEPVYASLGRVEFTGIPASANVHGVLGADILGQFVITLDLPARQARFIRAGAGPSEPGLAAARRVPLRRVPSGGWAVTVEIDGVPVPFHVTTSALWSTLSRELRERLKLEPVAEVRSRERPPVLYFRPRGVTVSGVAWPGAYLESETAAAQEGPSRLGLDFLHGWRAVFDLPAGELFLLPGPDSGSNPGRIGAGLDLEVDADGRVTVGRLVVPSPAEAAGIALGDEVLAIDGREVRGLAEEELRLLAARMQEQEVVLRVRRPGGEPRDVRLRQDEPAPRR